MVLSCLSATVFALDNVKIIISEDPEMKAIQEYDCDMYINLPKDHYNVCTSVNCGFKDENEGGEVSDIRKKYNINYSIGDDKKYE